MGRFLNQGNRKFAEFSRSKYFVDKTVLINKLLQKDADEKFVCNSRRGGLENLSQPICWSHFSAEGRIPARYLSR